MTRNSEFYKNFKRTVEPYNTSYTEQHQSKREVKDQNLNLTEKFNTYGGNIKLTFDKLNEFLKNLSRIPMKSENIEVPISHINLSKILQPNILDKKQKMHYDNYRNNRLQVNVKPFPYETKNIHQLTDKNVGKLRKRRNNLVRFFKPKFNYEVKSSTDSTGNYKRKNSTVVKKEKRSKEKNAQSRYKYQKISNDDDKTGVIQDVLHFMKNFATNN